MAKKVQKTTKKNKLTNIIIGVVTLLLCVTLMQKCSISSNLRKSEKEIERLDSIVKSKSFEMLELSKELEYIKKSDSVKESIINDKNNTINGLLNKKNPTIQIRNIIPENNTQ